MGVTVCILRAPVNTILSCHTSVGLDGHVELLEEQVVEHVDVEEEDAGADLHLLAGRDVHLHTVEDEVDALDELERVGSDLDADGLSARHAGGAASHVGGVDGEEVVLTGIGVMMT
jgi:hypothetical protein